MITAGDRLTIDVQDDGRGIGPTAHHSGLRNLAVRAQRRGGAFEAGPRGGGTRLAWSVPLDHTSPSA